MRIQGVSELDLILRETAGVTALHMGSAGVARAPIDGEFRANVTSPACTFGAETSLL